MKRILTLFFVVSALLAAAPMAQAAVMVNATQTRTIFDMAGYDGSGFSPTPAAGQLDSNDIRVAGLSDGDLDYGDTGTTGGYALGSSSGNVITGGFYDFSPAVGEPMFGIQPDDDDWNGSSPSYVDILFENNSGRYVNNISVEGELWVLNNGDRSSQINISLSRNGTDFLAIGGVTTPEASTAGNWNSTFLIADQAFPVFYINPGEQFTVRISGFDVSGTGDRDEFGFADIAVIVRNQSLPEPRTMGFLVLGMIGVRYARDRRQKYAYHDADEAKRFNSIKSKIQRRMSKSGASDEY